NIPSLIRFAELIASKVVCIGPSGSIEILQANQPIRGIVRTFAERSRAWTTLPRDVPRSIIGKVRSEAERIRRALDLSEGRIGCEGLGAPGISRDYHSAHRIV